MKKTLLNCLYAALILTSCTKMPGHYTGIVAKTTTTSSGTTGSTGSTGSSSSDGVGPVAIGATNTVIFKIGNDAEKALSSPSYVFAINSLALSSGSGYSTSVSSFDMLFTTYFSIDYTGTSAGTYKVRFFHLTMTGVDLQQTGATSTFKTKVISESIAVSNTQSNEARGTVKGTFDGYVTDTKSAKSDSVRV